MFFTFLTFSAVFIALSNLFIRKSVDKGGGAGDPYLFYRLGASALALAAFALIQTGRIPFDYRMGFLGVVAGLLLGALMWLTGRSLKYGSAGLTFMILNTACMAPPLLMALLFGNDFGHTYTVWNALGACFMIGGIYLGTSSGGGSSEIQKPWYLWIGLAFLTHAIYLSYFQWRALLLKAHLPASPLIPFQCSPETSDCFGILMFVTAMLFQLILPSNQARTSPKSLILFGIGGGIINGFGGFFMLKSTELAVGFEKALLFPVYCIVLIFLCNLWGAWLYKEKISWPAFALSSVGIGISCMT